MSLDKTCFCKFVQISRGLCSQMNLVALSDCWGVVVFMTRCWHCWDTMSQWPGIEESTLCMQSNEILNPLKNTLNVYLKRLFYLPRTTVKVASYFYQTGFVFFTCFFLKSICQGWSWPLQLHHWPGSVNSSPECTLAAMSWLSWITLPNALELKILLLTIWHLK